MTLNVGSHYTVGQNHGSLFRPGDVVEYRGEEMDAAGVSYEPRKMGRARLVGDGSRGGLLWEDSLTPVAAPVDEADALAAFKAQVIDLALTAADNGDATHDSVRAFLASLGLPAERPEVKPSRVTVSVVLHVEADNNGEAESDTREVLEALLAGLPVEVVTVTEVAN